MFTRIHLVASVTTSAVALAVLNLYAGAAVAEDSPASVVTGNNSQAADTSVSPQNSTVPLNKAAQPDATPPATTTVEAGVKIIELDLELLKEVGVDIKNVIKAAGNLYDEVNIRPVQIVTQPEVVGRGTIVYLPVDTRPIGPPAPPRKKHLDRAVGLIDPVVAALKQDVDDVRAGRAEIVVSDTVREELKPLFKEWELSVDDVEKQLSELHKLTAAPPYDNAAISARAGSIKSDATKLDRTRSKIYKILQKEERKKKR